jgi:hypothetical protein
MPCTATSRDLNSSLLAFAVISSCMMWPARVTQLDTPQPLHQLLRSWEALEGLEELVKYVVQLLWKLFVNRSATAGLNLAALACLSRLLFQSSSNRFEWDLTS